MGKELELHKESTLAYLQKTQADLIPLPRTRSKLSVPFPSLSQTRVMKVADESYDKRHNDRDRFVRREPALNKPDPSIRGGRFELRLYLSETGHIDGKVVVLESQSDGANSSGTESSDCHGSGHPESDWYWDQPEKDERIKMFGFEGFLIGSALAVCKAIIILQSERVCADQS